MTSEISEFDSSDFFSPFLSLSLETSIWNGREVRRNEASDIRKEARSKIFSLLPRACLKRMDRASDALKNKPPANILWIVDFLKITGQGMMEEPDIPISIPAHSASSFFTMGPKQSNFRIGGINGINTELESAASHADYLSSLASGQGIDWVYNQSHGLALDLAEVFSLNYLGCSPNTRDLLCANWTAFCDENRENSHAKYLQFCHSQGAIHVRNALAKLPKEIRDRVIVVAIAPAAVVPEKICFKSFNYASKKDCVHLGEFVHTGPLNEYDFKNTDMTLAIHQELIRLDPHPEAAGYLDHDFQSPTFRKVISDHILEYLNCNGFYL